MFSELLTSFCLILNNVHSERIALLLCVFYKTLLWKYTLSFGVSKNYLLIYIFCDNPNSKGKQITSQWKLITFARFQKKIKQICPFFLKEAFSW